VSVIEGGSQGLLNSGILGSVSSSELLTNINKKLKTYSDGVGYMGNDIINKGREFFVKNIVAPYKQMQSKIQSTVSSMGNVDNYSLLVTAEDFKDPCNKMKSVIMTYKPIRDLYREDRLYGYELDKKLIPEKDRYRQLYNNGIAHHVNDKLSDPDFTGEIKCVSVWRGDDPDITLEELDMIEATRCYIDDLLSRGIDPTSPEDNIK